MRSNNIQRFSQRKITNHSGFTLVEMLVVMVLLGLISSLLFQGLDLLGKVRQTVIPKIQKQHITFLQEQWFRKTISGLVAGANNNELFVGTRYNFKGLSVSPLNTPLGAPSMVSWSIASIKNLNSLNYSQQSATKLYWQIKKRPNNVYAPEFVYLNNNGQWVSEWQASLNNKSQPMLPQAIALINTATNKEHWWIASIDGQKIASTWLFNYD